MVDPMDNIALQARQGSVAAIIQILNEKLSDAGVRTRAMFEAGKLQLLCEAATPEQLEQSILVGRVQAMLEAIAPRNIHRVNINSRIVQEQQLLWLEEIHREPEKLLWSQEIRIRQPNPFQRWWDDRQHSDRASTKANLPKRSPKSSASQQFWRGIWGGVSLSVLLVLVGWAVTKWLGLDLLNAFQGEATPEVLPEAPPETPPAETSAPPEPPPPAVEAPDPFAQAVVLAQSAAVEGSSAQSAAEWLELAAQWQRAADLMAQVPAADPRYATAQNRVGQYQQNRQAALLQAETLQPSAEELPQ